MVFQVSNLDGVSVIEFGKNIDGRMNMGIYLPRGFCKDLCLRKGQKLGGVLYVVDDGDSVDEPKRLGDMSDSERMFYEKYLISHYKGDDKMCKFMKDQAIIMFGVERTDVLLSNLPLSVSGGPKGLVLDKGGIVEDK